MPDNNDSPFTVQTRRARVRLNHVESAMKSVERLLELSDRDAALDASFELAFQGEKLALQLRLLPALSGAPFARPKMERHLLSTIHVWPGMTPEGWFGVRFPALLPKKEKGSSEYIRHSLYLALGEYFKKHERVQFEDCVIIVRHVYDEARPERRWRDHDNIEVNAAIDAVALFVLRDDSPKACSHYYCSVAGKTDETHVLIIPKADFPKWLPNAENDALLLF